MLGLALLLTGLIGLPQVWHTIRYYPTSVRRSQGASEKMAIGNITLRGLFWGLVWPRRLDRQGQVDGVFFPEVIASIGLPGLLLAFWGGVNGFWWALACFSTMLAMGKRTPFFRMTHKLHLRNPARYCYFVGLALAMLAIEGFQKLPTTNLQMLVLLAQAVSLILAHSSLVPMTPYVQRWERPERAFNPPMVMYLRSHLGAHRVSGLPYPLRTGQIHGFQTLGYNGASQPRWMAAFRGEGAHDWFQGCFGEDMDLLDWYGVKYTYTMRPLKPPRWVSTGIPHFYENRFVAVHVPTWKEAAQGYGSR